MKDFAVNKAIVTLFEFDKPMVIVKRTGGATVTDARDLMQALGQAIAAAEILEEELTANTTMEFLP